MPETLNDLIRRGDRALQQGDTLVALLQFETAHNIEQTPQVMSKLAYCLAKERRQLQQALRLCMDALQREPDNPDHYYQLGRIYLIAGQKRRAIATFRKGLKFKRHQPSIDELVRIGVRKEPVLRSLPREHLLNRGLGILLSRFGSR